MRVCYSGAAGGIGRATVRRLLECGHEVLALDVDAAGLEALPEAAEIHSVDVTDADRVAAILKGAGIDAVVAGAGWYELAALEDLPADSLARHLGTNVVGTHTVVRASLPQLRARQGRIVILGSVLGRVALPYHGGYAAAKHALVGYADTLRREVGPRGVDVSLVEPGPVRTGFNERAADALADRSESAYVDAYRPFLDRPSQPAATGVEPVADAIVRAVEADRPRSRYRVSRRARWLPWLQTALPDRLVDRLVRSGIPGGLLSRLVDR